MCTCYELDITPWIFCFISCSLEAGQWCPAGALQGYIEQLCSWAVYNSLLFLPWLLLLNGRLRNLQVTH